MLGRCIAQAAKVLDGAERGMNRPVTALAASDRIGAARIVRFGTQHVVLALAICGSNRMDRRQIKHVEAHIAKRRQSFDHIVEGPVPTGRVGRRARK